ncbi:sugar ABC transporter ATP-binding protein [Nostoc sp. FACHB-152]|uniref:sugar ABC transporter ATP-binding protein n=1 Tax=unclassified Nostoc TaxID=2593658 RepID=UPI0016892FEE|nr:MULTISPECIES: sugar ABC transporter ATP-binding protein [unclassified Nostoc]MBD2450895.1 sugar ABC transporter ATP-binding protein [Nostoc sp. FACHB-152]MBD2470068.1 sugar ABC transporter ATP-binding protein [Nostoc sp. FACHB-145]
MNQGTQTVLRMTGIKKSFSGVPALWGVDFELKVGEIHALVGENGAGKSTLIKIMTGAYRRDTGVIEYDQKTVAFQNPTAAQAAGIVAVYQEIQLVGLRTVAENIFLGREPQRFGFVDKKAMNTGAAEMLERLGLQIDPRSVVDSLNIAHRQMVAIARAISFGARILILDEPTSSLTETEVAVLFDVMRRLKSQGTSIVYVSHRFEELYAVCDRVTVLRDGRNIITQSLDSLNRLELVCHMLDRQLEEVRQGVTAFTEKLQNTPEQPVLLQAEALKYKKRLNGVSLELRHGEIVGIAGLLGSGRSGTVRALFGAEPFEDGTVKLEGNILSLHDPHDAIAAGMAFLSEDRKADGIIPELSVRENLTLAALPSLTQWGIVSKKRQNELVNRFMQRLGIKAASADQQIHELSGGNQQKVLLARWLCKNTKLLLLDEPTRGIDVGAKREIQRLIAELAEQGLGVLMISSEMEELVEGSQRVVVLRDGQSVAELSGEQKNIKTILHVMAEADTQEVDGREQVTGDR